MTFFHSLLCFVFLNHADKCEGHCGEYVALSVKFQGHKDKVSVAPLRKGQVHGNC